MRTLSVYSCPHTHTLPPPSPIAAALTRESNLYLHRRFIRTYYSRIGIQSVSLIWNKFLSAYSEHRSLVPDLLSLGL